MREEKENKEEEKGKHSRHGLADLSEPQLRTLCIEVWPVLAVIGGVDAGLRVGGRCVHKQTGRHMPRCWEWSKRAARLPKSSGMKQKLPSGMIR